MTPPPRRPAARRISSGIGPVGTGKARSIEAAIENALDMRDLGLAEVTAHFGLACDLRYGVPSVIHDITTAPSFCEAVRLNIYAGGDTCGRAILLGAILGAAYGVGGERGIPEAGTDRLKDHSMSLYVQHLENALKASD